MDIKNQSNDEELAAECNRIYLQREEMEKRWYQKCINCATIIDVILFVTSCGGVMVAVHSGFLPHARQGFYCGDPTIAHSFKGDTVSTGALALVTLIGPLVIMTLIECMPRKDAANWLKILSWHSGILICLTSFLTFTTALKIVAGEPRPHFLETCAPDAAQNCTPGQYIIEYTCLNSQGKQDYRVLDAYMSFPSGHAGVGTMASIFCAVYILKRFNAVKFGVLLKPVLSSLVLAGGFMVSITRIVDRRHHWWDVMAGIVIGMIFVLCCIKYHCNSFVVKEKETCIKTKCPASMCRHSQIVSRGLSSRELLNTCDKNTYINM